MAPTLIDLPTEIRIMIYKELLVLPKPITFVADHESPSPLLHLFNAPPLYLEMLRVNRRIHNEAVHVLYSMNVFQFPDLWRSFFSVTYLSPFLREIGESNAQEIRQIRITFPSFYEYGILTGEDADEGDDEHVKEALQASFEPIHEKLPGLNTLELILYESLSSEESSNASAELLGLMSRYLGGILPPEGVLVRISKDENADSQLIEVMRECGWKIAFVDKEEKPEWKEPFYDEWGRKWDEDEYCRYQYKLEQQREQEEWLEEYYRRADPYWRNDSDYD